MTDITELTPEAARVSGSILIIVAARMARREFFTPLHTLCESGKRVVSTRALCDAIERAEEHMVSQVSKIVDGHDRLTKKLKEAESRNAELVEALEKAQQVDEELCKLLPPGVEYMDPPDGGDVTPLEQVRRMVADYRGGIAELEGEVEKWKQESGAWERVADKQIAIAAELESRTVKLPGWFVKDAIAVYDRDEIEGAMTAAGIKWEAE